MYLKQGTRTHFKELQRTMLLTTSVGMEEDGIAVSKLYFSFDCELQHRYAYKFFGRLEQGHGSTNKLIVEAFTTSFGHLGTGLEQDSILGLLIDSGGHNMRMGGGSRRTVGAKNKYLSDLIYIVILWSIEYWGKLEFLVQRVDNEVYKPCGYFPAEFKYQLFSNLGNHDDESIFTATMARKWGDYAICIQDMAKVMTVTKMKDRNKQSSNIILLLCHLDHIRVPLIIWHSLDPYIPVFTTVEGDAMLKVGHAQVRRWAQEVEIRAVYEMGLDSAELAAGFYSLGSQSAELYTLGWLGLLQNLLVCYGIIPVNSFIFELPFQDATTLLPQLVCFSWNFCHMFFQQWDKDKIHIRSSRKKLISAFMAYFSCYSSPWKMFPNIYYAWILCFQPWDPGGSCFDCHLLICGIAVHFVACIQSFTFTLRTR